MTSVGRRRPGPGWRAAYGPAQRGTCHDRRIERIRRRRRARDGRSAATYRLARHHLVLLLVRLSNPLFHTWGRQYRATPTLPIQPSGPIAAWHGISGGW